jgi:hypothetical protein
MQSSFLLPAAGTVVEPDVESALIVRRSEEGSLPRPALIQEICRRLSPEAVTSLHNFLLVWRQRQGYTRFAVSLRNQNKEVR